MSTGQRQPCRPLPPASVIKKESPAGGLSLTEDPLLFSCINSLPPESGGRSDDETVKNHIHGGHEQNDRYHTDQSTPCQQCADRSDHVHPGVNGDPEGGDKEAAAACDDRQDTGPVRDRDGFLFAPAGHAL